MWMTGVSIHCIPPNIIDYSQKWKETLTKQIFPTADVHITEIVQLFTKVKKSDPFPKAIAYTPIA